MSVKDSFAISTAAALIGVSTHTLRKWEDRHGAVAPARTAGGDRRYSHEDIERLAMLKRLIDAGHAIGSVATLTDTELRRLDASPRRGPGAASTSDINVAVLGRRLAFDLAQHSTDLPGIHLTASADEAPSLHDVDADALIVELPSLGEDSGAELETLRRLTGIDPVVVLYRFGAIAHAEQLSDAATAVFARPVNHRELARTLASLLSAERPARPELALPPTKVSRQTLSTMATMSPALACECPRHTAQLLLELSDFEDYSAQCENTKPHDAHIHRMLRSTAAVARSLFEDALIELAEAENIDLDEGGG